MSEFSRKLRHWVERESVRPDLVRGARATVAFMVPLGLAFVGRLPVEVLFAAIAAQNIALVDVRGGYTLRLTLLSAMTAIMAGAAGLGALAAHPLAAALAATLLVAAASGLWRHLSSDYGPSLATVSSLLFFIGVAIPEGHGTALSHAAAALMGGAWGVVLQVALWPIRPQHPLRAAVGESWLAAADLFTAIGPAPGPAEGARHAGIAEHETALRAALDKAYAALAAVSRPSPLRNHLEQLNLAAARLAMRVSALNSALEALAGEPDFAGLAPSFHPLLVSLSNNARSVALTVVSRQPGHLAAGDVRRERLTNLLRAVRARLKAQAGPSPAWQQVGEILRQIEEYLPTVADALRATIERADERAAFSLELFDLQTLTLRPLAAALHLTWRFDRALLRYTLRIATLTFVGVLFIKTHHLPHGYWLPFTMVVVLQPDYGSTRQKAVQRLLGTLAGSIIATALLWLRPPFGVVMAATAATSCTFGYFLKRNYGMAVIFITLFVVLLTEANGPVTWQLTAERLGSTVAGGGLALLAALIFWPVWERDRFRPVLTEALRDNLAYWRVIAARLAAGGAFDRETSRAKQKAEGANAAVFSSLQRMAGDPKNRRDQLKHAAAVANGNQRLTRALNLLALHLTPGSVVAGPELAEFTDRAAAALETLAAFIERPSENEAPLEAVRAALDGLRLPTTGPGAADQPGPLHGQWVYGQLARAATELSAMLLAA